MTSRKAKGKEESILAYVKSGSQRFRDDLDEAVKELGIVVQHVQSIGWITVYEVAGTKEALALFKVGHV